MKTWRSKVLRNSLVFSLFRSFSWAFLKTPFSCLLWMILIKCLTLVLLLTLLHSFQILEFLRGNLASFLRKRTHTIVFSILHEFSGSLPHRITLDLARVLVFGLLMLLIVQLICWRREFSYLLFLFLLDVPSSPLWIIVFRGIQAILIHLYVLIGIHVRSREVLAWNFV